MLVAESSASHCAKAMGSRQAKTDEAGGLCRRDSGLGIWRLQNIRTVQQSKCCQRLSFTLFGITVR